MDHEGEGGGDLLMSDRDVTYTLVDGSVWVVRAYHFDTLDEARRIWSKYEGSTRGGDWDFSVWAVSTPTMEDGLVVFCGAADHLPDVTEGTPFPLSYDNGKQFAVRRARVTIDAFDERKGGETYFETRDRYGTENPQKIDAGGGLKPWQKK
jgi:hypothetical protein